MFFLYESVKSRVNTEMGLEDERCVCVGGGCTGGSDDCLQCCIDMFPLANGRG